MEYHLEHTIRLNTESKHKSLYEWSLQEIDDKNKKIGSDQIPWNWSLYFTAGDLIYNSSINGERDRDLFDSAEDELAQDMEITDSEVISGTLYSGRLIGGYLDRDTRFSMFGTKRVIKNFDLRIYKLKESQNERCTLWGCVSYTSEVDFEDVEIDDCIQITLHLSETRFSHIARLIQAGQADMVSLMLTNVSGLYSDWSPSINTSNVKVLAPSNDQKIKIPQGCKINLPRLGEVGSFRLDITKRNALNLKQDWRPVDRSEIFNEEEEDSIEGKGVFAKPAPDPNPMLIAQIAKLEKTIAQLLKPLWIGIIVLILILLTLIQ